MSDYLKLAQELTPTPAPADNPYLSIVQDEQRQSQARARTVLETAFKDNPDTAAERQRLSQTSGLPLRVIERNLDAVRAKEQARAVDLIGMANDSPVLARQLLDPTFTTTAVDDLETLKKVERSIGHAVRYVMGADGKGGLPADLPKAATDVALGATAGVGEMIFNLAAVLNDTLGWDTGAAAARGQANRSRDARKEFGLDPESTTGEAVKSGLGSAGTNLAVLPMGLARGAFATAEAAATLPAAIMGAGVGADAYLQAREKGKSGVQAALFGVPQGTFEYLLERVPASKLFGDLAANSGLARTLGHQVVSEGWTEQVTTLLQDFNEWVNLNPEKSAAQFIAERPDAAYQTFIATLVGVGVQTTTLHAVNKIVEKASDSALTFQQDALEEQMKLIASSMLRQRSPEQFRAYVERVVEETEGARKEVYVDAEVLSQLPQDVLSQLPQSVRDAIPEALAANGTVAIPMVDVLTVAPGTALEQTLNDHARMTPDAITRAEAAAAAETLQQDAERVLAQAQDQEAARAEFDAVQADLAQQITTTGRYRPQVAETYAAGLAHFFAAYGSRTGLGTKGLYDAYKSRGFRIVGEAGTQGNTLEATLPGTISVEGYHFSKQARPSLSTAFYGTGLKGSARDEIMANPDTRLQKRLSFYFDKGTGVRPEAGVGGIAHRARLTNIYDADADVLGLRSGDARAFESALLDRGYSGYATRLEGTQPGQVILLGDQTIVPEVLGPRSSIAAGEVVPALPAEEVRWTTVASGSGVEARLERMRSMPAWSGYELRIENGELQARKQEAVYGQSRVKDVTPAVRKLLKNLTPIEQRKVTDATAAKIIAQLKKLPPAKEMAAVALGGKAKRGWYKQSAEAISAVFGPDGPRFAALLAATSPQCSVEINLLNALNVWKNWTAAGRPIDREAILDIMGASVQGGRGRASVLDAWVNNSVRALTAENPADAETSRVFLSGPKVNSFFLNLIGVTDEVTNDAWMANYALVYQTMFAGSMNVLGTDPGKGSGYLAMAARTREAAAFLTKMTGETWTPAEVQETVWSWAKTLYEMQVGDMTATRALEEGRLTDDLINSTPDFSSLFNDPIYGAILKEAGYGDRLDALGTTAQRADDAGADQGPDAGAEAGALAAEDQRRLQLQAARRLERLREQRNAGVLEQRGLSDGRPQQAGNGAGRYSSGSLAPLAGAPAVEGATGPDARLVAVAEQYARDNGIQLRRQAEYARVDPERAKRIAAAYDAMEHAPQDPAVRAAYEDLIQQTLAQYLALQKAGYVFTFMDPANDPYQGNPWNAMRDLRANQHMAVFPTERGFGSGATLNIGLADPLGGPNLSTARVMTALAEAGAMVKASATHESNTEPTLVVELAAPLTAEAATALAGALGQEAIAQQRGDGSGDLFGPAAEKWGAFNPEYFLTISGKTAAATANPLLADTGLTWLDANGQPKRVLANDLFRAVHDAFGHGLEGAGFRAQGEENAWQAHVRLFTGPAVGAITSETRGQNSWLNFGPHGEKNQTAAVEDTIFADQKTGLMPEWTWTEGRVGDESDVLNQPAYHGTPHRGIDKFSLDKIGTGEGAQAYGWGLYFAESKDIAEFYRDALTRRLENEKWTRANGEPVETATDVVHEIAGDMTWEFPNDNLSAHSATRFVEKAMSLMREQGKTQAEAEVAADGDKMLLAAVRMLYDGFRVEYTPPPTGQTYVVEVPDATDLLDYDAQLKDQPPKVKAALEKLGISLTVYQVRDANGKELTNFDTQAEARKFMKDYNVAGKIAKIPSDWTGENAYYALEKELGSAMAASLALRDVGIPGLRYLDASSRGAQAKSQSRNFVIFDESAVQKTGELYQQARGTFNPKTLELVLNPNTDLSTLWHEMGHFFLEVLQDVATQPNAPAQIAADYQTVLGWFGVTDAQWRAFSLDEKRKYHERWAESIEQYVMEGKVPNAELAPLMRRFAAWLKSVYTSIQKFIAARPDAAEIELNDDIRRVMDRMLATDQQIAEAEETAGLVFDEVATAAAQERLRKRSMADLKWTVKARDKVIRELQKKAKNERKRIEAEVAEEANALPAFAAKERLAELEKQHEADPFSADMNTAAVADAFGFASVDAMYREIEQAGEKQDYIDGRTEQRMLEEHGDLMNDDAIRAAANEAVHNDARARSLASELRTQAELLGARTDTGQTTAKGAKVTTSALVEAAKQFGANVVARTPLRDLKNKAWQHTAAERRASKAWQAATAAGKTQEAVQAKQDQVLNHAAARAALDAQAEAKKIAEFFARVLKGNDEKTVEKGRDPDIVNAARAVLALYGMQSAASKTAAEYLKAVKANDPDAWSAIEDMVETASANAQPLSALTFEQLQGLHEQIEGMWFLARRSRQMEVNGDLLDIEDAAADLGARMEEIGIPDTVPGEEGALTKAEQRTRSIRFFGAALKRVEQWAEGMDGKYGGPFLKLVFQPIKDAADRYRKDRVTYRKKFQKLVDAIAPSMRHELIEAPELGYTFGRGHNGIGTAELLHALLHTGNDSNKRKLLLGRGWATEGANGELDTAKWDSFVARLVNEGKLTTAHYDFLQGVWDLLEETKPLAQKAHRDVFGRYFAEVTATPFVDPFGASRRGGYVPAQADPEIVPDATLRSLAEMENESMAYSFPTTNKGFTKSRVEYNRPLKLDLRTLPQHLDKVLLFSHMEPAVRGVSKLLRQKGVSQPLNRIDPTAYAGTLLPWLNRAGKQIVETPIMGDGKTSRVLSVLRARAGAALMFANVSNTVQQITGLSSAAVKVKPSHLMRAVANVIAHPKQARQAVWDASSYMAERASNEVSAMNGQLEAILLNPSALEKAQTWTSQHAYFLQTAFDNVLSPIVWTGAYNQAVEDGMTEDQAVKFADGVVRQTQGSTLPEDVSRIETGSPAVRMFTQFIGYFNMLANTNATAIKQIAQETGLRKGAGRALYVALMGVLLPVWIAEAIAVAFRGGPDDEDKDGYLDDWLAAVLGMGTIKGVLAQVPFIGQLANAGISRLNNNPADDRVSLSPAVSLLEGAVGAPVSVYKAIVEDGSARKAVRDVASLVSIALGLPAVAVARPIGYAAGVEEGRIKPTGPVDMARGAITGAASPASR